MHNSSCQYVYRRHAIVVAMAVVISGAVLHTLAAAPPSTRRPNIVFFILDDMQRYMFNCLPEGRGKNLT
ncbi:MAG: hypothetical protein HON70_29785, partial [Lentisphaerae bacterium]|nr:hypothetical protein [Lentisphaerota bacterium]